MGFFWGKKKEKIAQSFLCLGDFFKDYFDIGCIIPWEGFCGFEAGRVILSSLLDCWNVPFPNESGRDASFG
jgi:hypothetical protein